MPFLATEGMQVALCHTLLFACIPGVASAADVASSSTPAYMPLADATSAYIHAVAVSRILAADSASAGIHACHARTPRRRHNATHFCFVTSPPRQPEIYIPFLEISISSMLLRSDITRKRHVEDDTFVKYVRACHGYAGAGDGVERGMNLMLTISGFHAANDFT